jgi:transcriptional regulatory protein RtcR
MRKKVVIGFLGTSKDAGTTADRWEKWRPTVSLCAHDSFQIDHLELLLFDKRHLDTLKQVTDDIAVVSPSTIVSSHELPVADPWDMAEVCGALLDFSRSFKFREDCDYYVHWTTGTHMAQACLLMLTESRHNPARIVVKIRVTDEN